jgi:hypothetical protein
MRKRLFSTVLFCCILIMAGSCSKEESTAPKSLEKEEAVNKVKKELLPSAVPKGASYFCLLKEDIVEKGGVIEEAVPEDPRNSQDGSKASITLTEDSWLFYLDLEPGAMFEHDLKFIIVGKSGATRILEAGWWPLVNGSAVPEFQKSVPDAKNIIETNVDLIQPAGKVFEYYFPPQFLFRNNEGFIIVQGLMPEENLYDQMVQNYLNVIGLFLEYENKCSGDVEVEGLVQGDADDVLNEIDRQVAAGRNPISLIITGHGNSDYVRLGGVRIYADQFRDKFASHPTTKFNFLLCSCHSGSFRDDLIYLDNIYTAHMASKPDQSAWPDWDEKNGVTDYNPADTGAEWISSFCSAANTMITTTSYWAEIKDTASDLGVPVSCLLLHSACKGGIGRVAEWGCGQDLDLAHRVDSETPQGYAKWEASLSR